MQIQAINRRAQAKYGDFVAAMDLVTDTFEPIEKLIRRMIPVRSAAGGWTITPPDELLRMLNTARAELVTLRDNAKRYESELVSRDWRV